MSIYCLPLKAGVNGKKQEITDETKKKKQQQQQP